VGRTSRGRAARRYHNGWRARCSRTQSAHRQAERLLLHDWQVGEIPKGPTLDPSAVFPLLEDKRWLVRHAAIRALDHSASPDVEARLVEHLSATTDAYDQTYCHAVLNHVGTRRALPAIEANLKSRKRDAIVSAELAVRATRDRYPD
jgi:hypothetical protein